MSWDDFTPHAYQLKMREVKSILNVPRSRNILQSYTQAFRYTSFFTFICFYQPQITPLSTLQKRKVKLSRVTKYRSLLGMSIRHTWYLAVQIMGFCAQHHTTAHSSDRLKTSPNRDHETYRRTQKWPRVTGRVFFQKIWQTKRKIIIK